VYLPVKYDVDRQIREEEDKSLISMPVFTKKERAREREGFIFT
jgi:hypothetical protein